MRTKYKIGERVLVTTTDGFENVCTITSTTTTTNTNGTNVTYFDNEFKFEESQIAGRITVTQPRHRNRRKNNTTTTRLANGMTADGVTTK